MIVQRNKFFYFIECILMGVVGYSICASLPNSYTSVAIATFIQAIIFIVGYISLSKINGSFVSLYGIFLIAFYFFQNGQIILYSLGVDYNYFYVLKNMKSVCCLIQ